MSTCGALNTETGESTLVSKRPLVQPQYPRRKDRIVDSSFRREALVLKYRIGSVCNMCPTDTAHKLKRGGPSKLLEGIKKYKINCMMMSPPL